VKLLFVNSAWPQSWGGGEKWTVEAARWCQTQGDEVRVVGWPNSELLRRAAERKLSITEFRFRGDFDPRAHRDAARMLDSYRPDLIIVNFNKEAWTFGVAAKRRGIPMLARHGFPLFGRKLHHRFLHAKLITRLVVNAESIREHYRSIGFPIGAIEVIHNGVASVAQRAGELRALIGSGAEIPLIVAAGRLESQKRFDRLVRMAVALGDRTPPPVFALFGQGPLEAELRRQVQEAAIGQRFWFGGFREEFATLIGDADLFVLTSDNEGTPNALLEAMSAGVACVAYDVGAVGALFHDELSDCAIDAGDEVGMLRRIRELLDNTEERSRVAKATKARAEAEFSFEASMQRFRTVFAELVKAQ
jgi:glycosyltransferase involved in cell wall biosynthesis